MKVSSAGPHHVLDKVGAYLGSEFVYSSFSIQALGAPHSRVGVSKAPESWYRLRSAVKEVISRASHLPTLLLPTLLEKRKKVS